ncbi:MAG: glycosyltransferase family 39 protein [Chloroflexota bacterium]|nr:glycosyltransferase family 39 protein [Chloroflexota bacterium]
MTPSSGAPPAIVEAPSPSVTPQTHLDLVWLPVATSMFFIVAFLAAAWFRLTYAYPMWAMETPAMQAVRRILHAQPLYGPPSLEYVPSLYTPLYFYVGALAAGVLGPSLFTLRLVSLLASLGSAVLIGHLVLRETRNRMASLIAAGLFVCTTTLSATSLDLARVDALCLCLMLAGLDTARAADVSDPRRASWLSLASGVCVGLAILTKQTAVALAVILLVHAALTRKPRRFGGFVLGAGLTVGVAGALLVAQYGAWPQLYLVNLPRQHALQLQALEGFWSKQILPAYTLPLVAVPLSFVGRVLDRDAVALRFWVLATLGMLGIAWGASLNMWSSENVLLPAFAILSAGFGLGLAEGLRRLSVPVRQVRVFRTYLLVLAVAQFAFVHYNPRQTSPLRSDVEAGQRLVSAIRNLHGSVFGPDVAEFLYQAGKGDQTFGLSAGELQGTFGGKPLPELTIWTSAYAQALDERRYDEVLLDPGSVEFFITDSTRDHGYVDTGPLIPAGDEYYRLDSHFMPQVHVWVPRERLAG